MRVQEVRTLRWLNQVAPHAAIVRVRDVFRHATHVCIVLPLLRHTLLDFIVHSADWSAVLRVEHTRRLAANLMVSPPYSGIANWPEWSGSEEETM